MTELFTVDRLLDMRRPTSRMPFSLTPDGRLLALSTTALSRGESRLVDDGEFDEWGVPVEEGAGSQVVIVDTQNRQVIQPFPEARTSWGAQWSPDGQYLVAYVQQTGMACLAIWDRSQRQCRIMSDVHVHPHYAFEVPSWTPDSRQLAVKLLPQGYAPALQEEESGIEINQHDPHGASVGLEPSYMDWDLGDLALVDANNGQIRYLVRGRLMRRFCISPDGKNLATMPLLPGEDQDKELVVVPLNNDPPRTIATNIGQSYATAFNWSPDSRSLAYISDGRLYTVPADGSDTARDISGAPEHNLRWPDRSVHVAPRWSSDGQTVYALSRNALWVCAADGDHQKHIDGSTIDRQLGLWVQPAENNKLVTDGQTLLMTTVNLATSHQGLALLHIEDGTLEFLEEFPRDCAETSWMAMHAETGQCYLVWEGAAEPAALWRFDLRQKTLDAFYHPSPDLDAVQMGACRLLEWTFLDGGHGEGALVLPLNYTGDNPLPMVVVHGDLDDVFSFGYDAYDVGNPHLIAARGYAVLYIDVPIGRDDPMKSQPGQVVPIIRQLIDEGIADPDRIGAYGISQNAYGVMSMLVQTDLYRTAVCTSGLYNLTAQYGRIAYWGWSVYGEDELGGTLWSRRDAHIENSPFFYLDRVKASLLLISGTGDANVSVQAEDAFRALRRLNKKVAWRSYPDEPHFSCDWSREHLRDMCNAVLDWFDEHLLEKV